MTDEAARSRADEPREDQSRDGDQARGPATAGDAAAQDAPAPSPAPPSAATAAAGDEPTATAPLAAAGDEPTATAPLAGAGDEPTERLDAVSSPSEPTRVDEPVTVASATDEVPPAWTPPAPDEPAADNPLPPPGGASPGAGSPPPPGGFPPPPPGAGGFPPPPPSAGGFPHGGPPPWFGSGSAFNRDKLVRPAQGRYIAGVCGALARATNTDPVLWRVLLAVLGFFGGVGVLIYLIGWLAIPGEGDTASPIESLVGRGRSGMSAVSVVLLGAVTVLTFGFIVHDGFRATLLAVAVIAGALLLIKRNRPGGAPPPPAPGGTRPAAADPADGAPAAFTGTAAEAGGAAAAGPATAPTPPVPPAGPMPPNYPPGYPAPGTGYPPPSTGFAPPTGGYRPPFAPHGPWGGAGQTAYGSPPPSKPPKRIKPPRERSKLGRITFFTTLFVLGMLALISAAGASIAVPVYFAAALATIALGLILGAWVGRARGLIFLALLVTIGLAVSSGAERWGGRVVNNVYRPQSVAAVADRYDFTVGNATLDLRAVNFAGADQNTTISMRAGQVRVLLPANVDTTATVDLKGGMAQVLGHDWDGRDLVSQQVTDLGADGTGGGILHLTIDMNAGNVEVTR